MRLHCIQLNVECCSGVAVIFSSTYYWWGHVVTQWLRHCATNWKVVGSILDCVIGMFH
jgi:hypothetical protein